MTQIANIADNMTESQKNAWKLLVSELAKYSDKLSAESYSSSAALLYLLKEDALAYRFDSDPSDGNVFYEINTNDISYETARNLGLSGVTEHRNLDFYSTSKRANLRILDRIY